MPGSVVFLVRESTEHVEMPVEEAEELLAFLPAQTLVAEVLYAEVTRAARESGGEVWLEGDEAPDDILRALEAMDHQGALRDSQRALLEALRADVGS